MKYSFEQAKRLPAIRARLDELNSMLMSLEATKAQISQQMFDQLSESYKKDISELRAEESALKEKTNSDIGAFRKSIQELEKESDAIEGKKKETNVLLSSKAISRESFNETMKGLKRRESQIQADFKNHEKNIAQLQFYLDSKGDANYYKDKYSKKLGNFNLGKIADRAPDSGTLRNILKKVLKIFIWLVVVTGIVLLAVKYFDPVKYMIEEKLAWDKACSANTYESYLEYANIYINGKHLNEANQLMEEIFWQSVKTSKNTYDIKRYLKTFPKGKYRTNANTILNGMVWDSVKTLNTSSAYTYYISAFPDGQYAQQARDTLEVRRNRERQNEMYLQYLYDFYAQMGRQDFNIDRYYADHVDRYYQRTNISINEIKDYYYNNFLNEFVNSRYVVDAKSLKVEKQDNYTTLIYSGTFTCYRKSKRKYEYANNTVRMKLNSSFRITEIVETDIRNVRFTDYPVN